MEVVSSVVACRTLRHAQAMLDNQEEICLSKETAAEAQKYIDLLLPIVEAEAVSRDTNVNGGNAQQERIEGDSFPSIISAVKFLPSPVVVPMSEIRVDTDGNDKDARDIQLRRDVERDTFVLNETPLCGSNGFDFILDTVIDQLRALAQGLAWWCESSWPLQQFACLILRAANRTESGGKGFDALRQSLASLSIRSGIRASEALLIVPSSIAAGPLRIFLSSGLFKGTNGTKTQFDIGLCANIEAVTVYKLYEEGKIEGSPIATVRACLSSCVCMQLSPPLLDPIALSLKSIGYYKSGNVKLEFDVEDVEGIIPHQNNPSSDVVHLLDRLGK